MRKDWKYALYLILVVGVYVVVKLSAPKQNDWRITFAHQDKEPYGTFALDQLLLSFFKNQKIHHSYKTIYELKDSVSQKGSVFILAASFTAEKADAEALLNYIEAGGTVFISAHHFYGHFADTLGLSTRDYFFNKANDIGKQDTSKVYFTNPQFDSTSYYYYKRDNIHNYFSKLDSAQATVIAKNDRYQPVTIRIVKGKGQLLLNCTPMAFTNIYLLSGNNDEFISGTLSFLPQNEIYRSEYYHLGRMEAGTPLRFILTTEPLKWAYYLVLISILLFMVFEAKRKQRIIPVITPLTNTTLEFISTIGNLYYQKGDHKNIAEKKIQFFFDQVRTSFFLPTNQRDELFIRNLAKKAGQSEEKAKTLIKLIDQILASSTISKAELVELNHELENFCNNETISRKATKSSKEQQR